MTESLFNEQVVAAANAEVDSAIGVLLDTANQHAVIGIAPAGAGKSYAIGTAVEAVRRAKLRVAVATPTNDQAFALVATLAARCQAKRLRSSRRTK